MYQHEEWKVIKEFPRYLVSNQGRIKSIIGDKEYILSPYNNTKGYLVVQLSIETPKGKRNIKKTVRVNRLVAQYFCENYSSDCEVHHIDLHRDNNKSTNLLCLSALEHRKLHRELRKKELQEKMKETGGK